MLRWIKNRKSTYGKRTGYKGIELSSTGKFVAIIMLRMSVGHNKPKQPKNIHIGSYDTLKEAKEKRVEYILSLL